MPKGLIERVPIPVRMNEIRVPNSHIYINMGYLKNLEVKKISFSNNN